MYSMHCLFLNNRVFALRSLCVSDNDSDDDLDDRNAKARIIIIIKIRASASVHCRYN